MGELPGHPGWRFHYHGSGLLLSGPDNEQLDVDFHHVDLDGASIDPYFFTHRVLRLGRPGVPEARLRAWLCESEALLNTALDSLRQVGLLVHRPDSKRVFLLSAELADLWEAVAAVDFEVPGVAAAWAGRFGETSEGPTPTTSPAFQVWASGLAETTPRVLRDLVPAVDPAALTRAALAALKGPVGAGTGCAIEALETLGATPGPEALAFATRLDPAQHNPYSACCLARWCLASGVYRQTALALIQRFSAQRKSPGFLGNPFDYEYALLTMEFAPERAGPLIQQALYAQTPSAYTSMAAFLSWVQAPWAHEALLGAARAREATPRRFLVGCLQHGPEDVAQAARALLPPPPAFPEGQPGITYEQLQYLNLRDEVANARARVEQDHRRVHPH